MDERGAELGLYAISVVAQLVGTGQQNIRLYERRGLLTPDRTAGGTRQYSEADLAVLRRISDLLDEGLNLAGVAKVLELEAVNVRLRAELKRARARARSAHGNMDNEGAPSPDPPPDLERRQRLPPAAGEPV